MRTYLVIPDLHVPYHDPRFVDCAVKAARILRPDGIIQLGDAIDCYQLSKFLKDPARKAEIGEDILEYGRILDRFQAEMKRGASFDQLEGNHEDRIRRFVWDRCPELACMVKPLEEMLRIRSRGSKWRFHTLSDWMGCRKGNVYLHHGVFYNKHLAASNLDRYLCNFVQGHSHRVQKMSNGVWWSVSLGHGADEKKVSHVAARTCWAQALGVLHIDGEQSWIDVHIVENGKTVIFGKTISG